MTKFTPRVFSGVQPTGNLHLGNYLGAIKRFVELQRTHECIYCVVDLHAITVPMSVWGGPQELASATRQVTAAFIAAGIDPKKHIVFNQSQVSAHAEMAWVFNCVARLGWLNRMTQFKEKAGKDREAASVGLYDYPVLMAADILTYLGTHVPVGDDQKQHLELCRDIAIKFNNDFAEAIAANGHGDQFFPVTEPIITGPATRVMSLRDGTKKMSKSDPSDYSRINLTDDAETITTKLRKAKTDPEPLPSDTEGLKARPEADNLVGIYAALADITKEDVLRDHGGGQFSQFKPALADLAVAKLAPIAGEMRRLLADPAHIDAILKDGAERADAIAQPVLADVKQVLGFVGAK
ncbi:MAG TPA: tryptophan--tRNA ligase [Bauldia sp.]|nr:tryptophan--tRNA ligase [Bauldia sp.]